ncbi:MAG: hypothetical protein KDK55_04605 [Chlamydiia bacterium]|nr:hypothetical protein [Chlamydiia bacterium]
MNIEDAKSHLGEIVKPFQQDLNRRQKRLDFIKKCIQCIEKNDFFQLDELLKSKQVAEVLKDASLEGCASIFSQLQARADEQIELYKSEFKKGLVQIAEKMELPMQVDLPRFFVMKGIEGEVNFSARRTKLGELTIKSFDPKRIVSMALNLKRKFYDAVFEPQLFINSLFTCYQEIIKKERHEMGDAVPIQQLYADYVWSLQSKAFLQNMDKAKFKGYNVEQFAIDFWRFFNSDVSLTEGGYCIRLAPGRIKSLWLIDQMGEKRQISHASFTKS